MNAVNSLNELDSFWIQQKFDQKSALSNGKVQLWMVGHTPHQSNMKIGSKFNHLIFANQTATQTIKGLKFRVLITYAKH